MLERVVIISLRLLLCVTFCFCNNKTEVNSSNSSSADNELIKTGVDWEYNGEDDEFRETPEYLIHNGNIKVYRSSREITEGSGDVETGTEISKLHNSNDDPFSCREPGTKELCSGNGVCIDDRCECQEFKLMKRGNSSDVSYKYSGKYCEECPYCRAQRCANFLHCVICKLSEDDDYCAICPHNYLEVEEVMRNITNDDKICDIEYSNGCFIKFKYFYKGQDVYLEVEKSPQCYHGGIYLLYIYWTLAFFLILIVVVTPKLCFMPKKQEKTAIQRQLSTIRRRRFLYSEIRPGSIHECSF